MSAINDPLAQTHTHTYLHLRILNLFVLRDVIESGDGRTTCETVITTSRDCGSAEWINIGLKLNNQSINHIFRFKTKRSSKKE